MMALLLAVTLMWDASASPGVTDYTVWWGYQSGQEDHAVPAGNNLSMTISDNTWAFGATVYFVAKCSDANAESGPSNEVSYLVPVPAPTPSPTPLPPMNLRKMLP